MRLDRATFGNLVRARELLADPGVRASVREVARRVAISPFHFIRLFESVFGVTPHQFRTRARIERAKELLASGARTVTDVCMEVGFSSVGSFSSLFARRVGATPSAYREAPEAPAPGCVTLMGMLPADAFRNSREAR
jgi:AraC-like DNA-binding protein